MLDWVRCEQMIKKSSSPEAAAAAAEAALPAAAAAAAAAELASNCRPTGLRLSPAQATRRSSVANAMTGTKQRETAEADITLLQALCDCSPWAFGELIMLTLQISCMQRCQLKCQQAQGHIYGLTSHSSALV